MPVYTPPPPKRGSVSGILVRVEDALADEIRAAASTEGLSLSDWMALAARDRIQAGEEFRREKKDR